MRLQTKLWSCRDHGFKDSDIHPFIPQLFIEPLLCAGTVDMTGNKTVETSALRELISCRGDRKRPCTREKGDGGRAGEGRVWSGRLSPRRPKEGGQWGRWPHGEDTAPRGGAQHLGPGTGDRARGRVVWWGGGAPECHMAKEAREHGLTGLGGVLARAGFEG